MAGAVRRTDANDVQSPITFIPQGIPYYMRYDWSPGCKLNICDDVVVVSENQLLKRGSDNKVMPVAEDLCKTDTVRIQLDEFTDNATDWHYRHVTFDANKLVELDPDRCIDPDNCFGNLQDAKDYCEKLGPIACYAVGQKTNEPLKLYTLKSPLNDYPFYATSEAPNFVMYVRRLTLYQDFFNAFCRSNLNFKNLELSHDQPMPMEIHIEQTGFLTGCQHLTKIKLRNIVFSGEGSYRLFYTSLSQIDVTKFSLSFDKNMPSTITASENFFSCPDATAREFECNVVSLTPPTTPAWSTTKTYTQGRIKVNNNAQKRKEDNLIIILVIAGGVTCLVITVGIIVIHRYRRNNDRSKEKIPLVEINQNENNYRF